MRTVYAGGRMMHIHDDVRTDPPGWWRGPGIITAQRRGPRGWKMVLIAWLIILAPLILIALAGGMLLKIVVACSGAGAHRR